MKIVIQPYPDNADCAFLMGLDDLHPEGNTDAEGLDFGKDFRGFFWQQMDLLTQKIPEIKITLFTVANWTDRSNFPSGIFWPLRIVYSRRRSYQEGFRLDKPAYRSWRELLKKKISQGNIVLSYHGLTHHNDDKRFAASQEFLGRPPEEAAERLSQMEKIGNTSGLPFEHGFRAPGWGVTPELEKILADRGFLYSANTRDFLTPVTGKKTDPKKSAIFQPEMTKTGVYNLTANCFSHQIDRAVTIAGQGGIIFTHGHIAKTIYGLQYVDRNFVTNIEQMVREVRNRTLATLWFTTPGALVTFLSVREAITATPLATGKVRVANPSGFDMRGITISIANKPFIIPLVRKNSHIDIDPKQMKGEKKVSVILTVYNGARMIEESLRSLATQTYTNLEIIVVNDGSTDSTAAVVTTFKKSTGDDRIHLLNQKNGGRSNARNNGFKKSIGEVITFCEDDAIYEKHYIENSVKHFSGKPRKLAGVIGPHYVYNRDESFNTRVKDLERRRNFYHYKPQTGWFYDRKIFASIGMYDESLELVEDVVPGILLRKKGYSFMYEPEARWLHREPAKLKPYLRRKFKGGVGMALLQKTGFRKQIVPLPYLVLLLLVGSSLIYVTLVTPLLTIILIPPGIIGLVVLRLSSIRISAKVSPEPLWFILIAVLYEYVWWASTLVGYLYGTIMTQSKIISYLRGR